MRIVIACGSMPFGPKTTNFKSLGGSETSALELSKALAARGHDVILFCNLPAPPEPDAFAPGKCDGVNFMHMEDFGKYASLNEHDLLIGVRDPSFMCFEVKAKKKVLWMHDIAMKRGMQRVFDQMAWTFDEIWTVSEWHRQQVHAATGYPLSHIVALRNGIVQVETFDFSVPRLEKQIVYAARPERGLMNLIMPGGVMEYLPDFKLKVAMYNHFPDNMKEFYAMIFQRMKELPNVEFIGPQAQPQMRALLAESAAYIYPTQFEETSCILARECIEQKLPFVTTKQGALPETLRDCGVYFEDWLAANGFAEPEQGTRGWCKLFAMFFREVVASQPILDALRLNATSRVDLYWDGVAEMVEANAKARYYPGKNTIGAAVIAMNNEDTILRMLNSLEPNVDAVQIALGPCTDRTLQIIEEWAARTKIPVNIKDVPKIEPWKFGFDDARNASAEGLETDWILWIDTDEALVGDIRKYARNSMLTGYMICQHHFTVEPRGKAPEIDRPARLFRRDAGYRAKGHIHEHFEVPEGGPGRCFLLPDVDIAHIGYVNEAVRKDRFARNFPFLEWDHNTPGEKRKLHHFLWFRDIIHRMRFEMQKNEHEQVQALAKEALAYYNAHVEDMGAFGPGIFMSLQYLGEINTVLGRGVPMAISVQLEDRTATIQSRFENYEQLAKVFKQLVAPEFTERGSRYF